MKETLLRALKTTYPFATVLALWHLLSYVELFPAYFLPPPTKVLVLFFTMLLDGSLIKFTAVTFAAGTAGFLIGAIVGLVLAVLCTAKTYIRDFFLPLISAAYPIPAIIWVPISLLWFGFSVKSLIFVVALASFFNVFYNTFIGIKSINPVYVRVAQNLNIKGFAYFREIIVFGSLPFLIAGMRLAVGASWRVIVGAEMLATTVKGLGWFLWRASEFFRYDQVFVGMITIGIVGLLLENVVLKKIEKKTLDVWY